MSINDSMKILIQKCLAWLKRFRLWVKRMTLWRRYDLGERFHAGRGVVLWAPNKLKIGRDAYIGRYSQIECDAVIGDYVIMANQVALVGRYDHHYQQVGTPTRHAMQIRNNDYDWKGKELLVEMGHDVWIGYGAIVLSGVKIGDGAIIAAGSVVSNDVEAFSIYAGVPAKKVADRFEHEEDRLKHEQALKLLTGNIDETT